MKDENGKKVKGKKPKKGDEAKDETDKDVKTKKGKRQTRLDIVWKFIFDTNGFNPMVIVDDNKKPKTAVSDDNTQSADITSVKDACVGFRGGCIHSSDL